MIKEFKEFVAQGSVLDAAVGFVLGLTFKAIVDSVVNGILMPVIGYITAGIDFSSLKIVLRKATDSVEEVAISYGQVIQSLVTFILVAFFLFLVVRVANKARRKKEDEEKVETMPEAEAESEVELLKEIRDLLSKED
ncbi:MAG: large conductance mechanosensitive channel protein MscL [Saccharofermentanales bacterium]|jgi:large conductance mechanosensitive channel|nr:large conductance mechanosensitive channel protein MscL [Clostridiaceae bacterium]HHU97988.1 large conductance mechanosensitive channel protein MscL [Petrimonas sp.]